MSWIIISNMPAEIKLLDIFKGPHINPGSNLSYKRVYIQISNYLIKYIVSNEDIPKQFSTF